MHLQVVIYFAFLQRGQGLGRLTGVHKEAHGFYPERSDVWAFSDSTTQHVGGFFIFHFRFFTKIYFYFRNLQKYTPAAQLPGGRHLVAPLSGGRDLSVKIFVKKLRSGP